MAMRTLDICDKRDRKIKFVQRWANTSDHKLWGFWCSTLTFSACFWH